MQTTVLLLLAFAAAALAAPVAPVAPVAPRNRRYIYGDDDRLRVPCGQENMIPYSAYGTIRIDTNGDGTIDHSDTLGYICSATLIGPNQGLTAGHCIWESEYQMFLDQYEGRDLYFCQTNCNDTCTDGGHLMGDLWVPQAYKDSDAHGGDDYGFFQLTERRDIGGNRHVFLAGAHPHLAHFRDVEDFSGYITDNINFTIAGSNPVDKNWWELYQVSKPLGEDLVVMLEESFLHTLDTEDGMSGAGVIYAPPFINTVQNGINGNPPWGWFLLGVNNRESCHSEGDYINGVDCVAGDGVNYGIQSFNQGARISFERACEICSMVYLYDLMTMCNNPECGIPDPMSYTSTTSTPHNNTHGNYTAPLINYTNYTNYTSTTTTTTVVGG